MRNKLAHWLMCVAVTGAVLVSGTVFAAESVGDYIDDAAITAKVKAQLADDASLKTALSINVDTAKNVVTLNGSVKSSAERVQAEKIAKTVAGVASVKNNLVVKVN